MADFFKQNELDVEFANDGRSGLSRALNEPFDLVLLDVMLPFMSGFQVLDQIRRRSAVPVIMLTARIEERDRVAGLNAGADDYLPKPFGPEELLARIRAVLRRAGKLQTAAAPLECANLRLNPQTREVTQNGEPMELTSIEFEILEHLMRSAGRVVSRDEFTTVLYQRQASPYERALDVHISHLRKKLEANGRPLIHTVRGVGYLMSAAQAESR
ncbi:MAG: response regulator transcription factor [Acidobacteria bacterium]|nr:response regulator transcription factor [Acidobacteriota bacterium]